MLHEITHEVFEGSFMFEPIDLRVFMELYAGAKAFDSSPSCVLLDPKGEAVGYLYAFFDGDYVVIKSLSIRKKYQGMKLGMGMIYYACLKGFPLNKKATISALFKTGIASEKIGNHSKSWFSWSHDYALLKLEIT